MSEEKVYDRILQVLIDSEFYSTIIEVLFLAHVKEASTLCPIIIHHCFFGNLSNWVIYFLLI